MKMADFPLYQFCIDLFIKLAERGAEKDSAAIFTT